MFLFLSVQSSLQWLDLYDFKISSWLMLFFSKVFSGDLIYHIYDLCEIIHYAVDLKHDNKLPLSSKWLLEWS